MLERKTVDRKGMFFVYILKDRNGHYYTGYTTDLERRIKQHNSEQGTVYTKGRRPFMLVYCKEYKTMGKALRAEKEIKSWTVKEKEELIKTYENQKQG